MTFGKKISIVLFLACLTSSMFTLQTKAESTIFTPELGKKSVASERFNGVEYVDYNSFLKYLFAKSISRPEIGEIEFDKTLIKSSPGSFFIIINKNKDKKVFQMNLPAISYKEKLWIPLESFLSVLSAGDILKYDFAPTGVFIELNGPKKAPVVEKVEDDSESEVKEKVEKIPNTKIIVSKPEKNKPNKSKIEKRLPEKHEPENSAQNNDEDENKHIVEKPINIHVDKSAHESNDEDHSASELKNKSKNKSKISKKKETPKTKGIIEEPPKNNFTPGKNADSKYSIPENLFRREIEEENSTK